MFPLLGRKPQLIKGVLASERRLFEGTFSRELREKLGDDPTKYVNWVRENYEWICPDRSNPNLVQIGIDEDAKALGVPIRNRELLDTCVTMLSRGNRSDLALRLLKRYTTEDFTAAVQWKAWLESIRDRLYFDEVGLFKFVVVPKGIFPPPRLPRTRLSVRPSPTRQQPVVIEAECVPSQVRPGEKFTLVLRVETAPGWHITAISGSKGPEIATSIDLKMSESVTTCGDWLCPEPIPGAGERLTYEGSFEFRRELQLTNDANVGLYSLTCTLGYQACDRFSCKKPTETAAEVVLKFIK